MVPSCRVLVLTWLRCFRLDMVLSFRFPPYTKKKGDTMRWLTVPKIPYARPGTRLSSSWYKWAVLITLVGGLVAMVKNKKAAGS